MTSFVQPSERDRVTVALFKRICREKAQERELLKCPCCHNILEALQLDEDSTGYQNIWWICKSTFDKSCNFPLDMPTDVFWVKRSPLQIEEGIIPRPNVALLPEKYRHMYPSLFPGSGRPSLMGSRCASSASGTSIASGNSTGSHTSIHTREMSLSSNMPSPCSSTGTYCPSVVPSEPAALSPLVELDDEVLLEDQEQSTRLISDSTSVILEEGAPSTSRDDAASVTAQSSQSSTSVSTVVELPSGIPSTPAKDPPKNEWKTILKKSVEEDVPSTADSSFDSDEEAAYQAAISGFNRFRAERDPKPPTRVFPDEDYNTYVMGTSGLMQALYERLDNLPVDSMADDDVMGVIQNTLAQIKKAPIRPLPPKAANPTPQFINEHRREYHHLAMDIISNVDFPAATAIARSQPTLNILSMPFSLRQATDGQAVLKAIGTNHRGVKRKQPFDQYAVQADVEAKAEELKNVVKKRQRQKKLDMSRHLQMAESEASLKEVRENVTLAASKNRERLDQERAKQYDKEQELKSKNLFKAKLHAITEARRARQLKDQQLMAEANQQRAERAYAEVGQSSELDSGSGFEQGGYSNNYYVNSYEETQRALHNPDDEDDDPFNNGFDIL